MVIKSPKLETGLKLGVYCNSSSFFKEKLQERSLFQFHRYQSFLIRPFTWF